MNKRQKLVQQQFINNEEAVIRRLKAVYNQSLKDITEQSKKFQADIMQLQALIDEEADEATKATLKSMQQSKIYQKQYQDALKKQINSILDTMQVEEFKTVSEYLQKCYEEGFIGTMYDLQGQGIPMCIPLDQEAMVRAVQTDSKINQGLYERLGEDVDLLKRKITAQVSRGISTGMSWQQVAQQLAAYTNIGYNNAVRIARTEGHRIQVQSTMDACYKAKDIGADVVKQWDAALDKRTRASHAKVDGEIRELDEPFSNGLMFPGDPNGGASEVVNCRCALLQRARWALDDEELETLKERAAYYGLDKTKDFDDYKSKYLKAVEEQAKEKTSQFTPAKTIDEAIEYAKNVLGFNVVKYGKTDVDIANIINKTIGEIQEKYPQINVDRIVESPKNARYFLAMEKTNYMIGEGVTAGTLDLGSFEWKSLDSLKKEIIEDIQSGNGVGNIDKPLESIIWHEYGHQYATILEAKAFPNIDEDFGKYIGNYMGKRHYYKGIVKEAKKVAKSEGWIFNTRNISKYASKNESEAFAEAFADININKKPSKESVLLMKIAGILK